MLDAWHLSKLTQFGIIALLFCAAPSLQQEFHTIHQHHHPAEQACEYTPLPVHLSHRWQLGWLLELEGKRRGAELGVLEGRFAQSMLWAWPSAEKYYCIDLWGVSPNPNYIDVTGMVGADVFEERLNKTKHHLRHFPGVAEIMRMSTTAAASLIEDNSLDFVYVDARHDFCGVTDDLNAYWPKLKVGGIMAGHDYMTMDEIRELRMKVDVGDWDVCENGTRIEGAVKGAVLSFASSKQLEVHAFYSKHDFPTWYMRKLEHN